MSRFRFLRRRSVRLALLAALPLALYFVVAERLSWRPRILRSVGEIRSIAWSRDGKTLAVATGRPKWDVQLWDVKRQALRRTIPANVQKIALSPDGTLLASMHGNWGCDVLIWDANSGKLLHTLDGWGSFMFSSTPAPLFLMTSIKDFSVSATREETLKVTTWDGYSTKVVRSPTISSGRNRSFLCETGSDAGSPPPVWSQSSNDQWGAIELVRSERGEYGLRNFNVGVLLFDAHTGQSKRVLRAWDKDTGVMELLFSPDGRTLAIAGSTTSSFTQPVQLWDTATGQLRLKKQFSLSLAIALTDHVMATISDQEHILRLWDIQTGRLLRESQEQVGVTCLAFSPDGATLATGNKGGMVTLWRVK